MTFLGQSNAEGIKASSDHRLELYKHNTAKK